MQRSSTPVPAPSTSQRPRPFSAFLPLSRALHDYSMHPDHFRMVRSTGLDARHDVDGLDRFLLACAGNGILVADLLARLPCSRQTATERTERLIALGYLTLWTVEASGDTQREEDAEAHERDTVRPRPSSGP